MPPPFPPPAALSAGRGSPGLIAAALTTLLARHGITRIYTAACQLYAVISVSAGLTVWTNGRVLWWDHRGQHQSWPAADSEGAATHLASLAAPRKSADPH